MMVKTSLTNLDQLFAAIASEQQLYLPTITDGMKEAVYRQWHEGIAYSDALNTLKSAKDFFFPQIQDMAKFRREGKTIQVIDTRTEPAPYVIFGVRACDVRSFDVLDNVFLAEPVDTYYQQRREKATILSMACGRPAETCFCTSFGIDPAHAAGDARCWKDGENLYMQSITEKGEKLITALLSRNAVSFCDEADEQQVEKICSAISAVMNRLPLGGLKPVDNRDRELDVFKSSQWAELSSHCLGCGSCTFVCPTCQCFDIEEFNDGDAVERYRCWDSCMYQDFTLMAGGQPRKTQLERFRQRFMHKLVYYPHAHEGMYSCVGCGRCLRKCPIHMNIAKVMQALQQEFPAGSGEEKAK